MSASDANTVDEKLNETGKSDCWYILDETGDTSLGELPKNISVPEDSNVLDDVKIDLSDTAESKDLSGTIEETKHVENTEDQPCRIEEAKEVIPIDIKAANDADMFRYRTLKSLQQNFTPNSTPRSGRKLKKRKRKQNTPQLSNPSTPCLGSARSPNKKKKRKKSVILVDSESDDSVIEIPDDPSIIVLSDDEIGVCSGTLTKPTENRKKKSFKPNPIIVEDSTGQYIKKTQEISEKNHSTEEIKKNAELYQPMAVQSEKRTGLRPIIIDGCNVAFGHGKDRFSSLGLKICVDYFKKLGHEVRVFIPNFRKHHNATTNPELLDVMEKDGTLCYTPSRRTDGKMIVSYDDRFIVQYADASGGVIVSRDNYRDLLNENPEWKETICKRLLMYTWVGDTIMFPKDPLGRHGPNLDEFLRF